MDENVLMDYVGRERHLHLETFLLVFAVMALWEFWGSRRKEKITR